MPVGMHIPPTSAAHPSPTCHPFPTSTGARARQLDRGRAGRADAGMQTCAYAVHGSELLSTRWYMALVVSPPLPLSPPSQKRFVTLTQAHDMLSPPAEQQQLLLKSLESMPLAEHERFLGERLHLLVEVHILSIFLSFYLSIFRSFYLSVGLCSYMLSLIT